MLLAIPDVDSLEMIVHLQTPFVSFGIRETSRGGSVELFRSVLRRTPEEDNLTLVTYGPNGSVAGFVASSDHSSRILRDYRPSMLTFPARNRLVM